MGPEHSDIQCIAAAGRSHCQIDEKARDLFLLTAYAILFARFYMQGRLCAWPSCECPGATGRHHYLAPSPRSAWLLEAEAALDKNSDHREARIGHADIMEVLIERVNGLKKPPGSNLSDCRARRFLFFSTTKEVSDCRPLF
jgi:hypothetical protein